MYSIKFHPLLFIFAAFLVFVSGKDLYSSFYSPSGIGAHNLFDVVIFCVTSVGIVLFLKRDHVTLSEKIISIRETVFRPPKEILLLEITEIFYGKQDWGTWTRGRKVIVVTKSNGEKVNFFSAGWILKNKRVELFRKLKDIGINVTEK